MEFPVNFDLLQEAVGDLTSEQSEKEAVVDILESRVIEPLKVEIENNREVVRILRNLVCSWRESDPGKYGDSYFFVNDKQHRVVVREFLPEGTVVCQTQERWNEYLNSRAHNSRADHDQVPIHFLVVTFDEVDRGECKKCRSLMPVIEHYVQTEDNPEGDDEWLKELFVLCPSCQHKTPVGEPQFSGIRLH